jgi:hypothetical protein
VRLRHKLREEKLCIYRDETLGFGIRPSDYMQVGLSHSRFPMMSTNKYKIAAQATHTSTIRKISVNIKITVITVIEGDFTITPDSRILDFSSTPQPSCKT